MRFRAKFCADANQSTGKTAESISEAKCVSFLIPHTAHCYTVNPIVNEDKCLYITINTRPVS